MSSQKKPAKKPSKKISVKGTPLALALKAVKKKLTKKTWTKRNYFAEKNKTLCMCVHGAGQSEVNPEVKKVLSLSGAAFPVNIRAGAAAACAATAPFARGAVLAAVLASGSLLGAKNINWNSRPSWVKKDFFLDGKNYGNLDLHYLMGMVGLTTEFNDNEKTILPMIKVKLDKAIKLATQFGV